MPPAQRQAATHRQHAADECGTSAERVAAPSDSEIVWAGAGEPNTLNEGRDSTPATPLHNHKIS